MFSMSKRVKVINIAWMLFGLVFAFSATEFFGGGDGTIYNFYNVGDVCEINDIEYNLHDSQEKAHQEMSGEVVLDNGEYIYQIYNIKNENKWNFFCLDLKIIHGADLQTAIFFMKRENSGDINQYEEWRGTLSDGVNLIDVPKNSFNFLKIFIRGDPGSSYYVNDMQLRETAPVFTWKAALRILAIAFAIYGLFTCIFLFIWKKLHLKCRVYRWVEVLQEFYTSVAVRIHESAEKVPLPEKGRRWLRTFLFALMFIYNAFADMQGTYDSKFKYHLVVYVLIILSITSLMLGPKLKKQNWNNALAWSWLALWGIACVSDFLVTKKYRFLGYVMILVVGFFFFAWNNMENRQEIIEDFARAIHIFMGFVVIFCLLFRTETEGMRYSGTSTNPSVFAMYLGVVWAVVLGEVEQGLREQRAVYRMLPYIAEGCAIATFCWKAQALGPMLHMLIVAIVWFLRVICYTKRTKTQRKAILAVLSFLLLLVPLYAATDWGINHIPQKLGKPITFKNDHPVVLRELGTVVRAEDASDSVAAADAVTVDTPAVAKAAAGAAETVDVGVLAGLMDKIAGTRLGQKLESFSISRLLSSRDYYYRAYLRNMNLLGHEKNPKVWGKRRLPHNAFLGIAYRYGVFAVVPYILMMGAVLVRTFRYGRKNVKYAGMPFWICLISILMSMTDNVELPFVWLPWIALYLMMGIVFAEEEQEHGMKTI